MSAMLQPAVESVTLLDQLSNANPTAADLRARAAFWRKYILTTPSLTPDQVDRLAASCLALIARADQMDAPPAPVVTLAAERSRRTKTKADNVRTCPAKPAAIGAERFWQLHGEAVEAIRAIRGDNWHSRAPAGETVSLTVPTKLCSMTGPLGGKVKWRRDWRMPAARFWPGGALPECGLDVAPPPPAEPTPLPGAGVAEVVAEQIKQNKRHRIVAKARERHALALRGGFWMPGRPSSLAVWLADAAQVRRDLASALFDWKVEVGLVDAPEFGVDTERELAGEA